jgi:sulfate permease, SulP family
LLAGVRKDMLNALKRVHIERHLPDQFIFPEEESDFSATLKAIRKAFELMHGSEPDEGRGGRTGTYYLV